VTLTCLSAASLRPISHYHNARKLTPISYPHPPASWTSSDTTTLSITSSENTLVNDSSSSRHSLSLPLGRSTKRNRSITKKVNELDQVTSKSCEERSVGHSESSTHQQRKVAAKHHIEAEYERQDDPNQIMDVNVRRRSELRET
jgi:hypothetical protein